jgi:hypothetical protein
MKKALLTILSIGMTLIFSGCNENKQMASVEQKPAVEQPAEIAKNTLITFFEYLSKNEFAKAVPLFSADEADWETPNIYSSEEDKKDKAKVFEKFCNATQTCLKTEVLGTTKNSEDHYTFTVQFIQKDGSIMAYGPFNGVDNDSTPPQTKFEYNVEKVAGIYKVMTSPLYRP